MSDQLLTIGELARRTGVATSTLHYYEELGLLPTLARISGQRRYPESAVGLVGVILLLRDVGFSLAEQKALLASRAVALDDWLQLARRKLAELSVAPPPAVEPGGAHARLTSGKAIERQSLFDPGPLPFGQLGRNPAAVTHLVRAGLRELVNRPR